MVYGISEGFGHQCRCKRLALLSQTCKLRWCEKGDTVSKKFEERMIWLLRQKKVLRKDIVETVVWPDKPFVNPQAQISVVATINLFLCLEDEPWDEQYRIDSSYLLNGTISKKGELWKV